MNEQQVTIRNALLSDVPRLVELSEHKRIQYQEYQPRFWRKAAASDEKQRAFFELLIERGTHIMLVYDHAGIIDGFIIANLVSSPPVYDPQGLTCSIDDFCVSEETTWETVGRALLEATMREARERGATQAVVVCGHMDQPKRSMLAQLGLTIASEWYVKEL